MSLYSFGTESRIRCAADYKSVFDGALFKVHQPHFLFLAKLTEQPKSRLGIVIAKKKVRRAHERNRVKRLARESFRVHQAQFNADIDIVVMPKVGIEAITNQELYQQLDFAWQKLQRLAKKHSKVVVTPLQN
ncbi:MULTISPECIES: ribonuclease P protein component [unclassified Acinetobacter]|uniref:ribonuclease P protein component n=1 Tax=unclassified Acinetobacter TaxID=196816 RepID=UPI0024490921|nr:MULTISPECIES: ribonuclease P protein component [unclassified Acinetobacter]MDH0032369.1 ribonuclease P protein component [Acinetobacter sp. GD04021]MDH0887983.1 ribonuclease P protein component [Acinetobacter sp. GD03873]MDH1084243.1 ribonuclease P protein component [Acinetobacter sp. GD03983]MDH2191275.1 ribonuclease P protein component [Acinetobacter sp. GD03645]MDH2204777.1 ribonuclease P protein component [Acinetobacter sp. GD03647]